MTGVLYCPCGMKMYENSSVVTLRTGDTNKRKYFRCGSWSNAKVGLSIGLVTPTDLQERAGDALHGMWASTDGAEYERGAHAAFCAMLEELPQQLAETRR